MQVCLGHGCPNDSCLLQDKAALFVPLSLEAFSPAFSLRNLWQRNKYICQKILKEKHDLLAKILVYTEITLTSVYLRTNVLPTAVHLATSLTAKTQNSESKLISLSSWTSFLFQCWHHFQGWKISLSNLRPSPKTRKLNAICGCHP